MFCKHSYPENLINPLHTLTITSHRTLQGQFENMKSAADSGDADEFKKCLGIGKQLIIYIAIYAFAWVRRNKITRHRVSFVIIMGPFSVGQALCGVHIESLVTAHDC